MPFFNKSPSPVAAMMREVEGLRLKDRDTVTERYKEELLKAEETRKQAQAERDQNLAEVAAQEKQYSSNTDLVDNALEDLDNGIVLKIKAIKDSNNPQTWKLFCNSFPLHRSIKNGKLRPVQVLLNPKEKDPENPKFHIDYTVNNDEYPPAYEIALALKRNITPEKKGIREAMMERILKDLPKISAEGQLQWFLQAVIIQPELNLINSPIPEKHGCTAAMQLAKDNNMAALITIDADLSEYEDFNIDFNKSDGFGKTIFDYALQHGHKELSLWLLEKTKLELSSIEKACIKGDLPELERLLAISDGSVNPAIRENAPLLLAVMHGHNDIVARLIASRRIDIAANNNIALITAIRYGYVGIAKQLIDIGADIKAQNDLALKFAKSLTAETQESRTQKQIILDFVLKAKLEAPRSEQEKTKAAIDIKYLWKNYKLLQAEQTARNGIGLKEQEFIKETINPALQELARQQAQEPERIAKLFLEYWTHHRFQFAGWRVGNPVPAGWKPTP